MTDSYFNRKGSPPDESDLRKTLGNLYSAYKEILALTKEFDHEWKYYGTMIGWQLKAVRKGKALFYLTPLEHSFRFGLAVRENETEAMLNSMLSATAKEELKAAKKYPEGYPLQLRITKKGDMRTVRVAIEVLRKFR